MIGFGSRLAARPPPRNECGASSSGNEDTDEHVHHRPSLGLDEIILPSIIGSRTGSNVPCSPEVRTWTRQPAVKSRYWSMVMKFAAPATSQSSANGSARTPHHDAHPVSVGDRQQSDELRVDEHRVGEIEHDRGRAVAEQGTFELTNVRCIELTAEGELANGRIGTWYDHHLGCCGHNGVT